MPSPRLFDSKLKLNTKDSEKDSRTHVFYKMTTKNVEYEQFYKIPLMNEFNELIDHPKDRIKLSSL